MNAAINDTTFTVQVHEGEWVTCVREDLIGDDCDTRTLPEAVFPTHAEAEAFIVTICGLMHCGGDPNLFRIVNV